MDSYGTLNSVEFAAQIKADDFQLRKEIPLGKENKYLYKILFLMDLQMICIIITIINITK